MICLEKFAYVTLGISFNNNLHDISHLNIHVKYISCSISVRKINLKLRRKLKYWEMSFTFLSKWPSNRIHLLNWYCFQWLSWVLLLPGVFLSWWMIEKIIIIGYVFDGVYKHWDGSTRLDLCLDCSNHCYLRREQAYWSSRVK